MFSSSSHSRVFYPNKPRTRTDLSMAPDTILLCLLSTPLPPALWFGCVVGVNAVMFLSSLHRSVIVPPHKLFRTRSASLWMLSKCFCREPWGGGGWGASPAGFYSSFRQVHREDSVECREARICRVQGLNSQDTGMLWAQDMWIPRFPALFFFFRPQKEAIPAAAAGTWPLCSTL